MKKVFNVLLVLLLLAEAGYGCWKFFQTPHILTHGRLIRQDAAFIDMQGKSLTPEDYEALHARFPQATILWDVPFQGKAYPPDTREITVETLTEEELPLLAYLPRLQTVHADGCTDFDALFALRTYLPECTVLAPVTLCGETYPFDAVSLELKDAEPEALNAALAHLPLVSRVDLTGSLPDAGAMALLRTNYPNITFHFELSYLGQLWQSTCAEIDLSGRNLSGREDVAEFLSCLPELRFANFTGTGLSDEEMMALADRFPDVFFLWDITFAHETVPTDVELIDLSNHTIENLPALEARLKYLPRLQKVIMSFCGISDEDMDALNRRHEDVRFVWSVKIGPDFVRTDATFYYPFTFARNRIVNNEDLKPLRYCTDMVAIDIGHMTTVTECDWVANMPNLKYLIIVETAITDISPLASLKNLVFLEIFTTKITDYTPLLECTALEDLNLGLTYGNPEPIAQMTWLKHLWWCDAGNLYHDSHIAVDILPEALPNTEMKFNLNTPNVNNGWRQLQNYKDMRDIMGVFYLA